MDYKEEYEAMVQRARELHEAGNFLTKKQMEIVCPELTESEDERIRKELIEAFEVYDIESSWNQIPVKHILAWLEKQEEQKPSSTEDMPYITDEHFYEREPADSFKYKLAEYMTKCCTKEEGPYGYTYGISAESILKMAEEELLKRGVVQKPVEWSKNDTVFLNEITDFFENKTVRLQHDLDMYAHWLKSLPERFVLEPQAEWSEEDVKRLYSIGTQIGFLRGKYSGYQKDIDWLHALAEKMGFHKCKTGEIVTEWKKEDIDDKMLSKPKQEWSEEDEKMLVHIVELLELNCDFSEINNEISWLKSLSHKKIWNKEDERILKGIIGLIDHNQHYDVSNKDMLAWLKSLRPRPHWKPSEEQMAALSYALQVMNTDLSPIAARTYQGLQEIQQNLKKM